MKTFLLRGVPTPLHRDGWWFVSAMQRDGGGYASPSKPTFKSKETQRPYLLMVLLVLLFAADFLFWEHPLGISLAIFAAVLASAVLTVVPSKTTPRRLAIGAAILIAAVLPSVDYIQPLSLVFYVAGLSFFAAWITLDGKGRWQEFLNAALRFLCIGPFLSLSEAGSATRTASQDLNWATYCRKFALAWVLPLVLGGVFIVLLINANPIVESWIDGLSTDDWPAPDMLRIAFWAVLAALIWPFLIVTRLRQRMLHPLVPRSLTHMSASHALLNTASITNSLILFNLVFAVQTLLDITYLWGGAALPEGMTYAQYAHRGAYPLVGTAILAGLFALVARPFARRYPGLKVLLGVWLLQNVLLVVSSLYRLDLYIDQYGLTYLRIRAAIWMLLIAIGLCLIGGQLLRNKNNAWLLRNNLIALVSVLYACTFINFADVIASHNLERDDAKLEHALVDKQYICRLGPTAAAAIHEFETETGEKLCGNQLRTRPPENLNWQSWGFRNWRVQHGFATATSKDY